MNGAHQAADAIRHVGDFARLDIDRENRTGIPEVVVAEGKTATQLEAIVGAYADARPRVIVSRIDRAEARRLRIPKGRSKEYNEAGRILVIAKKGSRTPLQRGIVAIVAAGTTDVGVAEEARVVAEEMGVRVETHYDVGVAGLTRLLAIVDKLKRADVIIAVAGREAALAPVVSGLVDKPVIGLPVSSGYGFGGKGEAALKAMLQSCSPITVTNIDAGFVAGACAAQIARNVWKAAGKGDQGIRRRAPLRKNGHEGK